MLSTIQLAFYRICLFVWWNTLNPSLSDSVWFCQQEYKARLFHNETLKMSSLNLRNQIFKIQCLPLCFDSFCATGLSNQQLFISRKHCTRQKVCTLWFDLIVPSKLRYTRWQRHRQLVENLLVKVKNRCEEHCGLPQKITRSKTLLLVCFAFYS